MTCAYYMGQSCGLGCCMTRAEQFAFYEHNEPEFAEFVLWFSVTEKCSIASKPRRQAIRAFTGQRVAGRSRAKPQRT